MARPTTYDAGLHRTLLEATAAAVASNGIASLNLRQLAQQCGTSTSAIYTLFGSKDALLTATALFSSESFRASQEAVSTTDSALDDLRALGLAYRDWALRNPALFRLMFSGALTGYWESADADESGLAAISPLQAAVHRGLLSGELAAASESQVVMMLWVLVHGLATLEMDGHQPPVEWETEVWPAALDAALHGWRP